MWKQKPNGKQGLRYTKKEKKKENDQFSCKYIMSVQNFHCELNKKNYSKISLSTIHTLCEYCTKYEKSLECGTETKW